MAYYVVDSGEFAKLISKNTLTVVDFTASWCGPCKDIAPIYDGLAEKYQDVTFLKVDVDEAQDIVRQQGVRAMPTFKFFLNSEQVDELEGADPANLEELVVKHRVAPALSTEQESSETDFNSSSKDKDKEGDPNKVASNPKISILSMIAVFFIALDVLLRTLEYYQTEDHINAILEENRISAEKASVTAEKARVLLNQVYAMEIGIFVIVVDILLHGIGFWKKREEDAVIVKKRTDFLDKVNAERLLNETLKPKLRRMNTSPKHL